MGDISELRGLVFVATFIGVLVLLYVTLPSQFFAQSYQGRTITTPEYFEAIDLEFYSETWNHTMDGTGCIDNIDQWIKMFDFGGHNLRFKYSKANKTHAYGDGILEHFWYWWVFETNTHRMTWLNKQGLSMGDSIEKTELDNDYTKQGNIRYTVKCDHFLMNAFFGFNETKWLKPSEAWNHNELAIMFAIEFDQVNTSINVWNIMSMALFFQLPDVHWFVNVLINIPVYITVAYISAILLMRAIGAIFGGGA